jgi:hypothetical protein
MCQRRAEHGHDCVADELLDSAAVALDHLLQPGVVRAEPGANVLGVGMLRGGREAQQVTEEHRDNLAFLAHRGLGSFAEWRCAKRAEREVAGEFLGAVRAGGHTASLAERKLLRVRSDT